MPDSRIIRNAVHCHHCDTVIESVHRHDFQYCNCPPDSTTRVFVDGGLAYLRRGYGPHANFTDLTETMEIQ